MSETVSRNRNRVRLYAAAGVLVLIVLAAAWRWTPLHEFAEPRLLAQWLRTMASSAWLPVLVLAAYIVGNAIMFPNTVMCLATILALGSWDGFWYATGGSMLAAVVAYVAARGYGPQRIKELKIKSVDRVSKALRHGGVVQITLLRLLPIAPFPVVNIMAGAAHVRPIPFLVGTFLGLLPGNLLFSAFGRQLRHMLANPTPSSVAVLVAVLVLGSLAMWYLHRLTLPDRAK